MSDVNRSFVANLIKLKPQTATIMTLIFLLKCFFYLPRPHMVTIILSDLQQNIIIASNDLLSQNCHTSHFEWSHLGLFSTVKQTIAIEFWSLHSMRRFFSPIKLFHMIDISTGYFIDTFRKCVKIEFLLFDQFECFLTHTKKKEILFLRIF